MSIANKMAHLFHWPSSLEYQQNLLQLIALPIGARGQLRYRKKWVNKSFTDEIDNINKSGGFTAIFWVLSCAQAKKDEKVVTTFEFACPLRLVNILNVEEKNDYEYINLIAKEFLRGFQKISKRNDLKGYVRIEFGSPGIPYPGVEEGYVYTGPKISNIEATETPSLEALYTALENVRCSIEYRGGITIKDYPLVIIRTVEKSKVNDSGLYELSLNQEYEVALSYYQGEQHRDRSVYINGNRFVGKSITDRIPIEVLRKSKDRIGIEVKWNNVSFIIPLNVIVKIPWHKWKWFPLFPLVVISAILAYLFTQLFPESGTEIRVALVFPLIVILLDKIWEVLTKKD